MYFFRTSLTYDSSKVRASAKLNDPLFKKRAELAAKIPHFWALVFEQAPADIDTFITPSDSKIFAECLETLDVSRFEIDDPKGSPRSFSLIFTFSENEYFTNRTLEKKFWWRKALDGYQALVSEPVKIDWKEGKDPTDGLTDASYELYQAKAKLDSSDAEKIAALPEYKDLVKKLELTEEASPSFFMWFGFVSSLKWISAEESEEASKKEAERLAKIKNGETVEPLPEDEVDDVRDHQESEVFPMGDELATLIADDLFPSAIRYYSTYMMIGRSTLKD